jgi:hypothetical protein
MLLFSRCPVCRTLLYSFRVITMLRKPTILFVSLFIIMFVPFRGVRASEDSIRKVFLPTVSRTFDQDTIEFGRVYEEFKTRNAVQISLIGSALEASIKKYGRLEQIEVSSISYKHNIGVSPFPKPAFMRIPDDSMAPSMNLVPREIQLPLKLDFPELEIEVPSQDTKGNYVWQRVKTVAHQINYATGVVSPSNNAVGSRTGWR